MGIDGGGGVTVCALLLINCPFLANEYDDNDDDDTRELGVGANVVKRGSITLPDPPPISPLMVLPLSTLYAPPREDASNGPNCCWC